jgi:hypothetical protein
MPFRCDSEQYSALKSKARQNAKKALEFLASDTTYPEITHGAIKDGITQILKQLDTPDKK